MEESGCVSARFLCVSACILTCPPLAQPLPIQEVFRKVKEMLLTRVLTSEKQLEGLCFYLCKARDGGDCRLRGGALLTALCPEQLREASLKLCDRAAGEHAEVTHRVRWSDTHL